VFALIIFILNRHVLKTSFESRCRRASGQFRRHVGSTAVLVARDQDDTVTTEGEVWWKKMTVKAQVRMVGNGEASLFAV